ncbi:heterokaryon incompatibility protein-domain-containing protein [Phlebopus sp. FC_14]|nr:heterokaryon incompatibility protein-domain-containing protein [Phlebopus sp. FC_14]
MRLLETKSRTLKEFRGCDVPHYAIFSHCWQSVELSYQDMQRPDAETLHGYKKVLECCNKALSDGYQYVWMDTCCIDKTSSSELSEAVNSMYRWYKHATVCYVYLEDFRNRDMREFRHCRWFTRGWTLQELIAPSSVIFFSKDWEEIGSKASLASVITVITGIPRGVLLGNQEEHVSIAQRMAWAARRQTTREEDRAYSLMGLFGISMPAIYGEGNHAFTRLQLEIMRTSNDQSIFAWKSLKSPKNSTSGLLASSPEDFLDCISITRVDPTRFASFMKCFTRKRPKVDYTTTNHGIHITLPMKSTDNDCSLAILGCQNTRQAIQGNPSMKLIGIHLTPAGGEYGPLQYTRVKLDTLVEIDEEEAKLGKYFKLRTIYVQEKDPSMFRTISAAIPGRNVLDVRIVRLTEEGFEVYEMHDNWERVEERSLRLVLHGPNGHGNVLFRNSSTGTSFSVCLGIYNGLPWSHLLPVGDDKSAKEIHKSYIGEEHADVRCRNLDWIHGPIRDEEDAATSGNCVRITIRKRGVFGLEARYLATICLMEGEWVLRPDDEAFSTKSPVPAKLWKRGETLKPELTRTLSVKATKVDSTLNRLSCSRVDGPVMTLGPLDAAVALHASLRHPTDKEIDLDAAICDGMMNGQYWG